MLTGHIGVSHNRATAAGDVTMNSLVLGSAAVTTLRDGFNLTVSVQKDMPLRTGYSATTLIQTGLNIAVTNRLTVQPYISLERTNSQYTPGAGVAVSYTLQRDMF